MKKTCTIKEIAAELGIAHSTVSRVLNNAPSAKIVSESMRLKIMETSSRMGYAPNINARRLVQSRSGTIGIVIPDSDMSTSGIALSDISLARAMGGMESVFKDQGYRMLLIFCDEKFKEKNECVSLIREKLVDGLIVWGARSEDNFWNNAAGYNIVMISSRNRPDSNLDYVGHDNFMATYTLTKRMIESGRRKIAYMDSFKGISISEERFAGYRQALADSALAFDEKLCFIHSGQTSCLNGLMELHENNPDAFDAVQCINDAMALNCGVMLQKKGLRIPEEVMLAGGDRIVDAYSHLSQWNFPILSFRPDCHSMGRHAAERVLSERNENDKIEIMLPVSFTD